MHPAQAAARQVQHVADLHYHLRPQGHSRMIRITAVPTVALIALTLAVAALPARAELHIDITHGQVTPMPIAIPNLAGTEEGVQMGRDIAQVMSADLERSGLFKPIDPRAFVDQDASTRTP